MKKVENMTGERPVESIFQEYVTFAKKHKLATVFILIWLVAPTTWSVLVTVKGWNASELETTIKKQSKEISGKDAKIQELQTILVPFKTIAIEKFTGTEPQKKLCGNSQIRSSIFRKGLKNKADGSVHYRRKWIIPNKCMGHLSSSPATS